MTSWILSTCGDAAANAAENNRLWKVVDKIELILYGEFLVHSRMPAVLDDGFDRSRMSVASASRKGRMVNFMGLFYILESVQAHRPENKIR